jgi:filamentous hemagglutinin
VLAEKFANDVPVLVKSHRLIEKEGVWYTQTSSGKLWRAKGNYDFVTINGHTYVAPSGKGHFNISNGATKVDYAGEIKFGYSSGTRGKISSWNNGSGHYTPSALNAWQARLPLEYFKFH